MQKPETRQADDSDVLFSTNHWTFHTDFGLQKSPPLWAASATCLHPWIECLADGKLTGAMTETTFYPNQFANPSVSNVYKCVVWPARFCKRNFQITIGLPFFKKWHFLKIPWYLTTTYNNWTNRLMTTSSVSDGFRDLVASSATPVR